MQRLALSYAPSSARPATLGLFALDTRLASLLRGSSEPMLAQLRLAWWRETLRQDRAAWPEGEPLLVILQVWRGHLTALAGLVDGWEALTAPAPLAASAIDALASARGKAFAALAGILGADRCQEEVLRMGRNWALADIASRLTHPAEQQAARDLMEAQDWRQAGLPRSLRPLSVLHGLAARSVRRGEALDAMSPTALASAVRLGLLGR